MRPRALDLFCGAGGAAMGLHRAGFDVVGVDIKPQPRYPFPFIQADALNPPVRLKDFDLIWASPPCQAHTVMNKMWNRREHPNLIPETRALLEASGRHYVIENVPGAPLKASLKLCGTMFGLQTPCGAELRRHRFFEMDFLVMQPHCHHGRTTISVFGDKARDRRRTVTIAGEGCRDATADRRTISVVGHSYNKTDKRRTISVTGHTPQQNVERNRVRNTYTVDDARVAMGMPWATLAGLSQAIPPAYAEHIGRYAMLAIQPDNLSLDKSDFAHRILR